MTIHRYFNMKIKNNSENGLCDFTIYVRNLVSVSATFCGHIYNTVFRHKNNFTFTAVGQLNCLYWC
jgi:hypothetical protein